MLDQLSSFILLHAILLFFIFNCFNLPSSLLFSPFISPSNIYHPTFCICGPGGALAHLLFCHFISMQTPFIVGVCWIICPVPCHCLPDCRFSRLVSTLVSTYSMCIFTVIHHFHVLSPPCQQLHTLEFTHNNQ